MANQYTITCSRCGTQFHTSLASEKLCYKCFSDDSNAYTRKVIADAERQSGYKFPAERAVEVERLLRANVSPDDIARMFNVTDTKWRKYRS